MHDRASRCGIRWGELRWADSGGRTRMSKRDLSEADICAKFITPHVENAGWDDATQIRREVHFTKGQIHVRGKMVTRGKSKFADYVLYYKPNIPIAIIEAKENNHAVGDGLQQALEYAEVLNIPFVFSSNGDGFVFHDRTGTLPEAETTLPLESFPSPARLWSIYRGWKGLSADQEHVVLQDYFDDGSERQPRYYQRNAINAATEAIAKGQNRLLLVMATGTGKTYTAFQIIWRLWKADRKKRVLYLADRNILIDQTMVNDFRPFGPAMAKLNPAPRTIESADGTTNQIANARPAAADRPVVRDLPRPVPGDHRSRGATEAVPRVLARVLRPDRHRRVPPWQRSRRCGLAGDPRVLLLGHPDRHDRHAEGDQVRLQHPVLRRAGVHLFAEAGYPRRVPRAVQGHQRAYRCRRGRIPTVAGRHRHHRRNGSGPYLQPNGLRPHPGDRRPNQAGGKAGHRVPQRDGPALPEDDPVLRRSGACGADAAGTRQRERRPFRREPSLRDAHHRRGQGRTGSTRQLHRPRDDVSGAGDHVTAALDRRRRADLPADRARPFRRFDDGVQADSGPGHAYP